MNKNTMQLIKNNFKKKKKTGNKLKRINHSNAKRGLKSCSEASFLKSDDVDAFTILAGREFQIGIIRDEKKYLRRLVRVRGTVSLNGWSLVLVLSES